MLLSYHRFQGAECNSSFQLELKRRGSTSKFSMSVLINSLTLVLFSCKIKPVVNEAQVITTERSRLRIRLRMHWCALWNRGCTEISLIRPPSQTSFIFSLVNTPILPSARSIWRPSKQHWEQFSRHGIKSPFPSKIDLGFLNSITPNPGPSYHLMESPALCRNKFLGFLVW